MLNVKFFWTRYNCVTLFPFLKLYNLRQCSLSFSDHQISTLSQSCCYHNHIRQLHCIRPYLDFKTASATATSIVHSKLDYRKSIYYNLRKFQMTRIQQIQNARAVIKAPNFCHIIMEFGEAIKNPAYRILQTEYSGCLDISAHA